MVGLLAGGCSRPREDKWTRARPKTNRVAGQVKLDGVSVERAKVVFHLISPVKGVEYSAFGYTNARGRFSLQTFRDGDGAVAGAHQVTVEKTVWEQPAFVTEADVAPPPVETSFLPKKYRSTKTSGLTAEVTEAGPNEFVFELSSK
jgi:hypothetical protein